MNTDGTNLQIEEQTINEIMIDVVNTEKNMEEKRDTSLFRDVEHCGISSAPGIDYPNSRNSAFCPVPEIPGIEGIDSGGGTDSAMFKHCRIG